MWTIPQETAYLFTFTKEILKGKLNLCAVFNGSFEVSMISGDYLYGQRSKLLKILSSCQMNQVYCFVVFFNFRNKGVNNPFLFWILLKIT